MLNLLLEICLTLLLFNLVGVIAVNSLGFITALITYSLIEGRPIIFEQGTVDLFGALSTMLATFVVGSVFVHNRGKIESAKLQTTRALGATIAHELRTPLATLRIATKTIKRHLPVLQENDPIRNQEHCNDVKEAIEVMESEIQYSNTIIDMILENSKENSLSINQFQLYSMYACIKEAMERYPFQPNERDLISVSFNQDFLFKGDKIAMINVLFNLLRNALYFIAAEQKGGIEIWSETGQTYSILYFKDTAKGISEQDSQKLFERFFTTTRHGTGLGLAYCKKVMDSFGGDISCSSELKKFTLFTMTFLKT